ncbi:MAG: universal stress protein [Deltaproteobacteria bacterium]|nr:universal stress protein [Deltaproteobacteria bacterium]
MFKKILFCTDFSDDSHHAFIYALHLAKAHRSKLLILHVLHEPLHSERLAAYLSEEKLEELNASQMDDVHKEIKINYLQKMKGFDNYRVLLLRGEPFLKILQTVKKESVHLIVMGTHGRSGLDHILFGSTAERVVRKSTCPVMTVRLPGKKFKMP